MNKNNKVLIIGGGFAGARIAQGLAKGGFTEVTLVDKKDYFEVTYAALVTLVQLSLEKRLRLRYDEFIQGKFQQGSVKELAHDHGFFGRVFRGQAT